MENKKGNRTPRELLYITNTIESLYGHTRNPIFSKSLLLTSFRLIQEFRESKDEFTK